MQRVILTAFILFIFLVVGFAQQNGCGTEAYKDPWLTSFQHRLDQMAETSDDTLLYVALKVHLLGNDDGTGYFQLNRLLNALCILNEDFAQANIFFYLHEGINYINSTAWNRHDDITTGAEMMFANNVEGVLNCYMVQDPAGNCGYNLPYAGLAVSKSCAGIGDHTWAHEVGHNLSLPHPFLGWEGGQDHTGTKPPNFSRPAPEYVTYDYTYFQDKQYKDTLIIDTALVERVDGSNCRDASDGFCDTKPDYLASRWSCDADSFSLTRQTDPDSMSFYSEGRLIMSYSNDNCVSLFSGEQIAAMRANLREEKPGYLRDQTVPSLITETVELFTPTNNSTTGFDNTALTWEPVEHAEQYIVQVSRIATFGFFETDTVVTGDILVIKDLTIGRKYYWRVRPFSSYDFCASTSEIYNFTAGESTGNNDFQYLESIQNVQQSDGAIRINVDSKLEGDLEVQLISMHGQTLAFAEFNLVKGHNSFLLENNQQTAGVYILEYKFKHSAKAEKIVLK